MDKLSLAEKRQIVTEISQSSNIFDWSLQELNSIEDSHHCVLRCMRNKAHQLVGLYATKRIDNDTVEIALILVLQEFRGLGYGKKLLDNCLDNLDKSSIIYISSRNAIVKKFLLDNGFTEVPLLRIPWNIQLYLLKSKLRVHKLSSFFRKGFLPGWRYYLKYPK